MNARPSKDRNERPPDRRGVSWPVPSGDLVVIEGWWPAWRSVQASPKMCRASIGVGVDDQGPCPRFVLPAAAVRRSIDPPGQGTGRPHAGTSGPVAGGGSVAPLPGHDSASPVRGGERSSRPDAGKGIATDRKAVTDGAAGEVSDAR